MIYFPWISPVLAWVFPGPFIFTLTDCDSGVSILPCACVYLCSMSQGGAGEYANAAFGERNIKKAKQPSMKIGQDSMKVARMDVKRIFDRSLSPSGFACCVNQECVSLLYEVHDTETDFVFVFMHYSFDFDKSNSIDKKELGALLYAAGVKKLKKEDVDAILHTLDTNGSGVIDFDEFWAWFRSSDITSTTLEQRYN